VIPVSYESLIPASLFIETKKKHNGPSEHVISRALLQAHCYIISIDNTSTRALIVPTR
jgi:hypothetical protein